MHFAFHASSENSACTDVVSYGEAAGYHEALVVEKVSAFFFAAVDAEELFEVDKFWLCSESFECVVGFLFAIGAFYAKDGYVDVFFFHGMFHLKKCVVFCGNVGSLLFLFLLNQ